MEFVYVVPRDRLFPDCYPQGLVPLGSGPELDRIRGAIRDHGYFVERDHAERTPSLKQIIPYSIAWADGRVLLMRRLAKGGENRLKGKLSIGVGGHINPMDVGSDRSADPVEGGTRREIAEELEVRGSYEVRTVGLLNDDSNPVGAVHVGWVQMLLVKGTVHIREDDVLEGSLVTPAELRELQEDGANFETWSSILVEHLEELMPEPLSVTS